MGPASSTHAAPHVSVAQALTVFGLVHLHVTASEGSKSSNSLSGKTHVNAVHQVEELLDAVLSLPSLTALYLFGTVLEVLGRFNTLGLFAVFADLGGDLHC